MDEKQIPRLDAKSAALSDAVDRAYKQAVTLGRAAFTVTSHGGELVCAEIQDADIWLPPTPQDHKYGEAAQAAAERLGYERFDYTERS